MENTNSERELACILFPGVVKDEDRAIQCMGGLKYISQVYSKPTKKRLGLSFQPENPYMKRIFATMKRASGALLRVRVKKKREGGVVKREVVSTDVVGRVNKMFEFDSLCDFQYMPVHRSAPGQPLQCLLDHLPSGLDDVSLMEEPAPLLVTPANFTRADHPFNYCYTEKRYVTGAGAGAGAGDREGEGEAEGEVHSRVRKMRTKPVLKYEFNLVDLFPSEPHKVYLKALHKLVAVSPQAQDQYQILQKCFEERPIWSQNLLRYSKKLPARALKVLLPCVAFHLRSGPWRSLWLRYGYDPRTDPEARRYQVLDFRLRHRAGVHTLVSTREQACNWRRADRVKYMHKRALQDYCTGDTEEVTESVVCFRPGLVPAQRQTFFMYADIAIPEVQAMLEAPPPPGALCHPSRGWLPPHADATARDLIFRHVRETAFATHQANVSLERASSDEEYRSEADPSSADESEPQEPQQELQLKPQIKTQPEPQPSTSYS